MTINNNQEKLTPAACEALDELLKDLKEQILSSASRNSFALSEMPKEITVRDIMSAFQEFQGKNNNLRISHKQRYYRLLFISGIVYSAFGFLLFLLKGNWLSHFDTLQSIGLIVGLIGMLISLLSLSFSFISRSNSLAFGFAPVEQPFLSSSLFIQKWIEIEISIRNLISFKYGESTADKPLFSLINDLKNNSLIGTENLNRLKKLLDMRNGILHGRISPSQHEIKDLLINADELLSELKKKMDKE